MHERLSIVFPLDKCLPKRQEKAFVGKTIERPEAQTFMVNQFSIGKDHDSDRQACWNLVIVVFHENWFTI